jgi:hypothetical protein
VSPPILPTFYFVPINLEHRDNLVQVIGLIRRLSAHDCLESLRRRLGICAEEGKYVLNLKVFSFNKTFEIAGSKCADLEALVIQVIGARLLD